MFCLKRDLFRKKKKLLNCSGLELTNIELIYSNATTVLRYLIENMRLFVDVLFDVSFFHCWQQPTQLLNLLNFEG